MCELCLKYYHSSSSRFVSTAAGWGFVWPVFFWTIFTTNNVMRDQIDSLLPGSIRQMRAQACQNFEPHFKDKFVFTIEPRTLDATFAVSELKILTKNIPPSNHSNY